MADRDAAARARSFGAIARTYHRHRPGYPEAALDWALAPAPSGAADRTLLDLGAGTGKLTASLLPRAQRVIAVDPDPEMLAVLRATLAVPSVSSSVTALAGSAEAIPLPDASVDAVLIAQAFHWFDREPAIAEIVRVVRPGGVIAPLWNYEDRSVDWIRGYYDLIRAAEATGVGGGHPPAPRRTGLEAHPQLEQFDSAVFDNPVPMTIDGLLDNLATFSWISTLERTVRDATLDRARKYLLSRPETRSGRFELPLRTTVLRAVRRACCHPAAP